MSRRELLLGAGALAAGFAAAELSVGTSSAVAAGRLSIPGDFPWVNLGDPTDGGAGQAAVEMFASYAGKLAFESYKGSGSPG